jgi:hypothetical protein
MMTANETELTSCLLVAQQSPKEFELKRKQLLYLQNN